MNNFSEKENKLLDFKADIFKQRVEARKRWVERIKYWRLLEALFGGSGAGIGTLAGCYLALEFTGSSIVLFIVSFVMIFCAVLSAYRVNAWVDLLYRGGGCDD